MLETIGESAVRMTTRTDSNLAVEHKDLALEKVEKAVKERPVESSQESSKPEADEREKTDGYNMEDGNIFFEKYDKNGNVIVRLPPEKKPIDELA
ncbi:hypothetical protein DSCA_14830 [Desulfosarcina alkanivorans]|uniref:Uncharacterized protein n=2 Tax=Desulfosarcina alkanivorans TaxID=571177 RepID=A0A5K7YG58_9BACT|nr:hypothetical protein DSCA_14830 [Desulfosarcina alkanivorans]